MLIPKPKLHQLAQDAIDQLAKENIACAPDEILWLNESANATAKAGAGDPARFLDLPVPCGNVLLWPPSIGAKHWFKSVSAWFEFDERVHLLAQAYVMAFSRQPEILQAISNRAAAIWKILRWSQRLTCSLAELSRAVEEINAREEWVDIKTPREEKEEKTGAAAHSKADWGEILARLNHFYPGRSLAYWLWEISDETVATLLDRSNLFLPIEQQITSEDKTFREHCTFRLVVKYIRESHQGPDSSKVGRTVPLSPVAASAKGDGEPSSSAPIPQQIKPGRQVNDNDRPDNINRGQPDKPRSGQENKPGKPMPPHQMPGARNQEGGYEGH